MNRCSTGPQRCFGNAWRTARRRTPSPSPRQRLRIRRLLRSHRRWRRQRHHQGRHQLSARRALRIQRRPLISTPIIFQQPGGNPRPPYTTISTAAWPAARRTSPSCTTAATGCSDVFFEGLKDSDPANSPLETGGPVNYATVPTTAERAGDFSGLLESRFHLHHLRSQYRRGERHNVARQPFAGNIIPTSRLNPCRWLCSSYYPTAERTRSSNG